MSCFYSFLIFKSIKLPIREPNIKLEPTIKLSGSSIVSSINKLTLLLFELFCIETNKVNLLIDETVNLPISFIVGVSFLSGSILGSIFTFNSDN